jgi:antitoxin (DNA-binding transcriptional repressor) of toxin-antitoxin stability system
MLRAGKTVQITKRRQVIAQLTPEPTGRPPLPDFQARMRANYGDKVLEVTGADLISADREDRF